MGNSDSLELFMNFRSNLTGILGELLRLLLLQVDDVKSGRVAVNRGAGSFWQTVAFTLDHSRLENAVRRFIAFDQAFLLDDVSLLYCFLSSLL